MKVHTDLLHAALGLPADCEIEVAPENEDGLICVIVSHDSIPDECVEVTGRLGTRYVEGERVVELQCFEPVLTYPTGLSVAEPA